MLSSGYSSPSVQWLVCSVDALCVGCNVQYAELVMGWSQRVHYTIMCWVGVGLVAAQNQKQLFGHPGPQGHDPLKPHYSLTQHSILQNPHTFI